MTVEQLLDQAADLIVVAQLAAPNSYSLYAKKGHLEICKNTAAYPAIELIHTFNSADSQAGLSSFVWNRIDAKIRTLHKKGLLK